MALTRPLPGVFQLALPLLLLFHAASSQSFLGVNYGQVADNLPAPVDTSRLLQSTYISKVRLYGADAALLQALAGTNISVVITASNSDIPSLATNPSAAVNWVAANVLPFHPATAISIISVGNEVFVSGGAQLSAQLLPAMRNLYSALKARGLDTQIKVSTVHPMSVLGQSDPPSSGRFDPAKANVLQGILGFLRSTSSPFMVNPYPYFAYQSDPRPETLAFCLFQPNPGRLDLGTNIRYMNMFDAQVDAVRSAVNAAGFPGVDIVVAETGWPYRGDPSESGASLENAKAYNGNLVAHLKSMVGTPLMPRRSVDTYLFELFDENLKPGASSEKAFGLYKPSGLTMNYDIGLAKSTQKNLWCVPKEGATDVQLQANLDYACGQPTVDCRAIQPGGSCFLPDTLAKHSAYAMNMLYQTSGRHPWNCDFHQTGTLTSQNPSYGSCLYPS